MDRQDENLKTQQGRGGNGLIVATAAFVLPMAALIVGLAASHPASSLARSALWAVFLVAATAAVALILLERHALHSRPRKPLKRGKVHCWAAEFWPHALVGQNEAGLLSRVAKAGKPMCAPCRHNRTILRTVPDSLVMVSPDGTLLHTNKAGAEQLGATTEDLTGQHLKDVLSPEQAERHLNAITEATRTRQPFDFFEPDAVDGHYRSVFPVTGNGSNGDIASLVIADRGGPRTEAAQAGRLDGQLLFSALEQHSPSIEIWIGVYGKPVWANQALENLTGFTVKECMDMPFFPLRLVRREDHETISSHLKSSLRGEKAMGIELQLHGTRGRADRWVSLSYHPIIDRSEAFRGSRWTLHDISTVKQKANELAQASRRFQAIAQSAPDAIISIDHRGRITSWNRGAETIFGHTGSEVHGKSVEILMPERFRTAHAKGMQRYIDSGKAKIMGRPIELAGLRRDGTEFPVEMTVSTWTIDDRPGFSAIIRDIGDRKVAEEKARKQEATIRAIYQAALDGIVTVDHEGTIIEFNPAAEIIFGYKRNHAIGKDVTELLVSDDLRKTFGARLKRLLHDDKGFPVHQKLRVTAMRADGSRIPVELAITRIPIEGPPLFTGYLRDLTEELHVQEELRCAATVFRSMAEAIVITDPDNRITKINPAFTAMTGFASEDVLGEGLAVIMSRRDDTAHFKTVQEALQTEGKWKGEGWCRRKSGEGFPAWLSMVEDRDGDGGVVQRVGVISDISVRKEAEEIIRHRASYDALTNLPNRALFLDRLSQAMAKAQRDKTRFALMFLDLDHFKPVNDTLGHGAGDDLLREISHRLVACVRESDTVARHGGDEFTVILPEITTAKAAEVVAKKILEAVERPIILGDNEATVSASIGVALFPHDAQDAETLLKNADIAMYRAKERGRNTYQFFSKALNEKILERARLTGEMERGLQRGEFQVEYQPYFDIESGKVLGAEALVRWKHPRRGVLLPSQFIRLAEDSGLIVKLAENVLRTACQDARSWQSGLHDPIPVSVNWSGRSPALDQCTEIMQSVVAESGLSPECLAIEMPESLFVEAREGMAETIDKIQDVGVGLAIDNFGRKFSALNALRNYPICMVKIDQGVIGDIVENWESMALVNAIVSLAGALGGRVIAKGVETEAQMTLLRAQKCPLMQGFALSRPLSAKAFRALIGKS